MTEELTLRWERVDDIPLLLAQFDRRGVQPLLDAHYSPHGNGVGLSSVGDSPRVAPIRSEADHRRHQVDAWAEQRLHTLRGHSGQPVHPLNLSDDRLADVLEAWRDDKRWQAFEGALTQRLLRVYDLQPDSVRRDSTTAGGYGRVTEDGLFQVGPS